MRSLPRRLVGSFLGASLLGALATTLAPAAAYAGSWHTSDGRNDVVEIPGCVATSARVPAPGPGTAQCRTDPGPYTPDVSHPTADLRRLGVRYAKDQLTLTARLADMPPHADSGLGWLVQTKATDGLLVAVSWRGGGAHLSFTTLTGTTVTCAGATVNTQPARGLFKATLPVGCVHKSPWIKVGLRTQARDHGNCYIDDAVDGEFDPFLVGEVGYGPKVRRG